MGWLDTLLVVVIIGGLLLIVASKVTKQTISEMIGSIIDLIKEKKEESIERYLD